MNKQQDVEILDELPIEDSRTCNHNKTIMTTEIIAATSERLEGEYCLEGDHWIDRQVIVAGTKRTWALGNFLLEPETDAAEIAYRLKHWNKDAKRFKKTIPYHGRRKCKDKTCLWHGDK